MFWNAQKMIVQRPSSFDRKWKRITATLSCMNDTASERLFSFSFSSNLVVLKTFYCLAVLKSRITGATNLLTILPSPIMASSAASSSARSRVLAGYRQLNRARIELFRGDEHAMKVTREQMRAEFLKHKHMSPSGAEWEAMVAGIDEATNMLQHEIIRGELNRQTGRYGTWRLTGARERKQENCRAMKGMMC